MAKGPASKFTTTTSLSGASMDSNEGGETTATRFGNFEVLTNPEGGLFLLGGGGFGKTYKARHVYLNQIVALKVINDRLLHDNSAKERFLREAQVVNSLRHPHIAHVLDFGEVKNSLYYAMEFCGGGNLEHMVNRLGPLPLPVVVRCARQLAEALGCAHHAGFIHRDVKPANVMLTSVNDTEPELKLVDFGLVKNLQQGGSEATAALTMTGQQFFTIQFASPEQLMEEELDARSDLFALGMTLWFLLKGKPPETGSMASIVAKRLDQKSYESQLPADLPAAWRAFLARLLEKDRGQRFQDTDEVLAALAAAEAAPDVVPGGVTGSEPEPEPEEPEPEGEPSVTAAYAVHENLGPLPLGTMYRATRNSDGQSVAITMINDELRADPAQRAQIESNVARLQEHPHESIARVFGLEEYQEGLALIQEWHQGVSLHEVLKSARFLPYVEALRLLAPIAQGTDWATEQGLPGTVMAMDEIYLQPLDTEAYPEPAALLETPFKDWPPFRVRLLPYIIREDASQDVGMTLSTDVVSEPTVAFGCLLYHLVAGHQPRALAKLNKSGYVTIGRLAEDSNRLLASCIVNERDFGGCEGVLRALNTSEGVSFPPPPRTPGTDTRAHTGGGGAGGVGGGFSSTSNTGGGGGGRKPPLNPKADSTGLRGNTGGGTGFTNTGKVNFRGGDTGGGNVVLETKTGVKTSTLIPGKTTNRVSGDLVRQAEEARLRRQAEEDALLKKQAEEEAWLRRQAEEEDRLQREAGEEEERLQRQAEEARLKQEADEVRQRRLAEEARLRREAEEARQRKREEDARLKREADEARQRKREEEAQLKKIADDERRQKLAEEMRLKKLADDERRQKLAEELQFKKQAEEERKAQAAEEARLKKLADDERRAKLTEDARLKKQVEDARLKKLAEEARLKKLLDDEARQKRAAEEAQDKQIRLKTIELDTHKTQPKVDDAEPYHGEERRGVSPLLWVGIAVAVLALAGAGAFFLLRKPAPPPVAVETPSPTPVVAATPSPTEAPATPPPATHPTQFVFAQGFNPPNAQVRVGGQLVRYTIQGAKVVVPLNGAVDSLVVEAPGWDPKTIPVTPAATEDATVALHRQQGEVKVELQGGRCDYTTAVFKGIAALSGQQAYVRMNPDDNALQFAKGTESISLPTGLYQITLQGPDGPSDQKVQAYVLPERRFPVTAQANPLRLPPSFAGRYHCDFRCETAPGQDTRVQRTIVIDPGLSSGHMDDVYPELKETCMGTMITDLFIDNKGTLHGRARFSLRSTDRAYDEQFELAYVDGAFSMVGGGWEVLPTSASEAEELKKSLGKGDNYVPHTNRPLPPKPVLKD